MICLILTVSSLRTTTILFLLNPCAWMVSGNWSLHATQLKEWMNECRHGHLYFEDIVDLRKLHLSTFEFTVRIYEKQVWPFFSQIIIFISLHAPFTDVGKLFFILNSNSNTAAANPIGIFLKEKGQILWNSLSSKKDDNYIQNSCIVIIN